jgi:hypothetical protein
MLAGTLLFLQPAPAFSQCALVCRGNVSAALDANGQAVVYPSMVLQSSVGCSNNFSLNITDAAGNSYGNTVTAALLGVPLTATLVHPASGNSCTSNLTVTDNLPPIISLDDTLFIWCNTLPIPENIGIPVVSDNATDTADIELVFSDTTFDFECFDSVGNVPVTAYIERTWVATDESGNSVTAIQRIFVKRALLSQVVFPRHRDGVQEPALECGVHDPNNLSLTGQPTVEGRILNNTFSCDLVVSRNDQSIPVCGGSVRIIRTWTVFDLCTDEFRVFSQIIKVNDTQPPVLTCPAPVSFNTYTSSCTAQVWLPQATATDACSGAIVTASWQYGTGNGPFNAVPVGTHTVTYTAKDGCNNVTTCESTVKVVDDKKPTALCQSSVQANLEADGTLLVFAQSFNNGSYDNCGIGQLLVSRDGQNFDEFIDLSCNDLEQNIAVTVRVYDLGGLFSQCNSSVVVRDNINPDILCPPAITMPCGTPYNNPAQTGQPYATDNCTVVGTSFTDAVNLNNCGAGVVTRTWKATDQSGNFSTCQQTINIADNSPITVTFPQDVVTYECEPNTDPSVMGAPVVTGRDCEQLQITNTDYLFYTAEPACFKVIRKWAVINWCVYQPNDPNETGFWEHTQIIEVRDSVAPILTCPADMVVGIQGASCLANVTVPLPTVDDCSEQIQFSHNSPYGGNGSASGIYPKGVHQVVYTAADGCGNAAVCSFRITVTDAQAPNPVCNNGVSVTIQQSGYVTVTPAMINNGSYDNCSPAASLILQVSPNTFDCQSLGVKTVTLTVTDQAGNSAFCQTNVAVQDNLNVCTVQTTANIAGKMLTEGGSPLAQKLVGLSGGLNMAIHTDVDGTFAFSNLPAGQSYTLTPNYNTKLLNGVTTFDLVLIRRHILNLELLNSPYKMIAADVNKSNSITTFDLVQLQKVILNIETQFPNNNKSWRFVPKSYVFPNPQNPFSQAFPESITINPLALSQWNQDFVGIKVGDVNGSANPADFDGGTGDRSQPSWDNLLIFKTKDMVLEAGVEYAVPFTAANDASIAGFQFTLDFDENSLEWRGMRPGALTGFNERDFGRNHAGEGTLTASFHQTSAERMATEESLFYLVFFAKKKTALREALTLNSRITPAEAYLGASLEIAGVSLEFEQAATVAATPQLYQNSPNPFQEKTTIRFYLPEAAQATLRLYDVFGKMLQTLVGDFAAGEQSVEAALPGGVKGLIFCELAVEGRSPQVIKMLSD